MPRARNRVVTRARHRKVLERTKGHRGKRRTNYKVAHESMLHALDYSFEHRRKRPGDFRKLWIARINAAARINEISYSRLMHGRKLAGIDINRKMLADLAVRSPEAFSAIAGEAKAALPA